MGELEVVPGTPPMLGQPLSESTVTEQPPPGRAAASFRFPGSETSCTDFSTVTPPLPDEWLGQRMDRVIGKQRGVAFGFGV